MAFWRAGTPGKYLIPGVVLSKEQNGQVKTPEALRSLRGHFYTIDDR